MIHLTGSTAFRASTHIAIQDILQTGWTAGYSGSSLNGANQAIFTGHTKTNNIYVIIKTSWSGSVGGVQTVSQQIPISTWLTNNTPQSTTGTSNNPVFYDPPYVPDVCMSDGFQSSTPYPTPALNDQIVGIVPFKWLINNGAAAAFGSHTNITPELAQALWLNGSLPLALFTGNNADENTLIFAIGRDADSGTRLTTFAESGIGVFTAVEQWVPTNSSGIISAKNSAAMTGQELYPQETINTILYTQGHGGYSSGGDVAAVLKFTGNSLAAVGGYYLSYVGISDANNALAGGATELQWNGVSYSTNAVQEGRYTFWGYEHLDYRSDYGTVSSLGKQVADQIAGDILATDAPASSGLLLGSMNVSRATDGGLVTPNYGN